MAKSKANFEFKVRYDGKLKQIDSNTLINSLLSITTALQEINEELNKITNLRGKLQIRVNAFPSGSFLVDLELFREFAADLLGPIIPASAPHVKKILTLFSKIVKLKGFLKGEKPQKIEEKGNKVIISNSKGNKITVENNIYNNFYINAPLNEAIENHFETLRGDPAIEAFEVSDNKNKPLIKTSKKDFDDLIKRNKLLEEETKTIIEEGVHLHIVKLAFEERYKWQFTYRGIQIFATIGDTKFLQRIDRGEKFSKGDVLVCKLEIELLFDKNVNDYLNRSYKILEVSEHKPRSEQQDLLSKDE